MDEREADILYIKQRKVKQWTIVLLFLLFLAAGIRMRVTNVEVQGNDTYTAEEAENLVFSDYWDRNTVLILFNNLTGRKKTLPFVADYKIVLKSPYSCELRFYEKAPIGCIRYMSNYMYFDKDGIMIESSPKKMEGIPVVEGLNFGYVVLGRELPLDNRMLLNSIMSVTQQLALYEIPCGSIKYNENNNTITAVLDNGDIEVYLGSDEGLAAKISVLHDMLPEIRQRGLKGTLDLSTYNDKAKGSMSSFKLRQDSDTPDHKESSAETPGETEGTENDDSRTGNEN